MDDTQTMLRAIINGQSVFRQDVLSRFDKLEKKLTDRIDGVENSLSHRINEVEKKLTKRLDMIGRQLAYLEDDTPTIEDFDNLVKRVDRLEQKSTLRL